MEKTVPSRIQSRDLKRIDKKAKEYIRKRGGTWRSAEVIHEALNALDERDNHQPETQA